MGKKSLRQHLLYGRCKRWNTLIVALATQLDTLMTVKRCFQSCRNHLLHCKRRIFDLENWGALGLPLPKQLKNALAKLKEDNDADK